MQMNRFALPRQQNGVTLIGWIVIIALVVSIAMLVAVLTPVYVQNFALRSVMDGMKEEPGVTQMTPKKIKDLISRRLYVNEVREFDMKNLNVEKKKGHIIITADYEIRRHLAGNIDAVLTFNEKTDIPIL